MALEYENSSTGGTAQYNGNIATMQWNTHINGTCGTRQLYRFSYDGANRLTAAAHRTWSGSAWTDPARYNESGITRQHQIIHPSRSRQRYYHFWHD